MDGEIRGARATWAVVAGLAAVTLVVGAAGCASLGAAIAESETLPPSISVKVVDSAGAPIHSAKVSGQYSANPGPVASTSGTMISLGFATTGPDGRAILVGVKRTDGTVEITAGFQDRPARTVRFAGLAPEVRGKAEITIVLGPAP